MNRKVPALCLYLVLTALWTPPNTIAAEERSIDCTVAPYKGELFPDLYKSTKEAAQTLCTELMWWKAGQVNAGNTNIRSILKNFAAGAEEKLEKKKLKDIAHYQFQFDALKNTFGNFDITNARMPEFKVKASMTSGAEGYFEPLEESTDRFAINEIEYCGTISPDSSCRSIFEDFASAFNPYRSTYDSVYDNSNLLSELGGQWGTFLGVSKSQTVLEVWLTTWANSKHFKKNQLVGPPSYQVIALHPQLVYDSMSKASDGSNQEFGLAVEWIGVNFWDLNIPLGISFTSIYVDRQNENEVGHGALLHIYNHYGVGWARHGDADSFYVTIDLLKMLENEKGTYDKYMKSYL